MKSILMSIITLVIANSAAANQGNKITYSKIEICDSGYCDATECQISMIDSRGIKRIKSYAEFDKHQPRICEVIRAEETIVVKYLERSKLCIQDDASSDFTLNYVELEYCEFYRYGR